MKVKSKKPKKQRKALFKYKNHQRSKLNNCRLADFLQEEYGAKKVPIRVSDNVRVTRGEFRDFEGVVIEVTKNQRVKIKECTFDKTDGTQFHPTIHISNLIITKFRKPKKMDPWRASIIERKAGFLGWEDGLVAPKKGKQQAEEK